MALCPHTQKEAAVVVVSLMQVTMLQNSFWQTILLVHRNHRPDDNTTTSITMASNSLALRKISLDQQHIIGSEATIDGLTDGDPPKLTSLIFSSIPHWKISFSLTTTVPAWASNNNISSTYTKHMNPMPASH